MKENYFTIYDLNKKLLGDFEPIGESGPDANRLKNMENTMLLIDKLLIGIADVIQHKDRVEYSIQLIGATANKYLKELKTTLNEWTEE